MIKYPFAGVFQREARIFAMNAAQVRVIVPQFLFSGGAEQPFRQEVAGQLVQDALLLARIQKLQPLSAPSDVRRYFVSPEESGQICMLACMLGNNREIFFPKLAEAQMMTFDAIATELLHAHGYEVLECSSDTEAIEKAESLKSGSKQYPVHFSKSDTSGEKPFEEFVTDTESADMDRFSSLGVITGKAIPDKKRVQALFDKLNNAFEKPETTKEEVVSIMKDYLPNFEHIETGKSLDSKM